MQGLIQNLDSFQLSTIFAISSILDVWLSSECVSVSQAQMELSLIIPLLPYPFFPWAEIFLGRVLMFFELSLLLL